MGQPPDDGPPDPDFRWPDPPRPATGRSWPAPADPPPAPPPRGRPPRGHGPWVAALSAVLLLGLGVVAVTALVAPGFLVDDSGGSSGSRDPASAGGKGAGGASGEVPEGAPEVGVPPPGAPSSTGPVVPEPGGERDGGGPGGAADDPAAFGAEFLDRVAAGDAAAVDAAMCAADQEWQYEEAVAGGLRLTLSESEETVSEPGGLLGDLHEASGATVGRISVLPDDAGGLCVETFYLF